MANGEPGRGLSYWGLRKMNEGGLRKRSIFLCGSSMRGNLQGGLLYWGPRRICQIRLWKRSIFLCGSSMRGNLEGGLLVRKVVSLVRKVVSLVRKVVDSGRVLGACSK